MAGTGRLVEMVTERSLLTPGRWGFDLLVVGLIFLAYALTLGLAMDLSLGAALVGAAANTAPVILFGAVARWFMIKWLATRGVAIQIAGHVVLCLTFTLLSLWLLFVLLGLANGASPVRFDVRPFPLRSLAWQSLEDVTTYGVVAALSYLQTHVRPHVAVFPPEIGAGPDLGGARAPQPEQPSYFVRSGDDIRPIDLDKVVSIAGADDYAEVTLVDGKHLVRKTLVRKTLAEFERSLDAARFVRVHRSRIVNLGYIERAEPAGGGRMLLHMQTGEIVSTSRTGARLLRGRVI